MSNETHEAGCVARSKMTADNPWPQVEDDSRCNCMLGEVRRLRARVEELERENNEFKRMITIMRCEPGYVPLSESAHRLEVKQLQSRIDAAEALLKSHLLTSEDYRIAEYFRNKESA